MHRTGSESDQRDCSGHRSFDQNAGLEVVQAPTLIALFVGVSMYQ